MINVTYHYISPSWFTIFYLKTAFPLTKFLLNNSHEIIVSDNLIGLSEVEKNKIKKKLKKITLACTNQGLNYTTLQFKPDAIATSCSPKAI